MNPSFVWTPSGREAQLFTCVSPARTWDEFMPALVASWVQFAEVLGVLAPPDVRDEIELSFFCSGGRVTFCHGTRDYPVKDFRWDLVPTDYAWCVMCKCPWIEEQWYAVADADADTHNRVLGELGVSFARHCLSAAGDPSVREAFRSFGVGNVPVHGQGATQSPAAFSTDLESLFSGKLPELRP